METLEEMRAQFEVLKMKLERQEIISERMFREVTKKGINKLRKEVYGRLYAMGVLIAMFILGHILEDFTYSIGFYIASGVLVLFALYWTIVLRKDIFSIDVMADPMLEMAEKITRYRKHEKQLISFGLPLGLGLLLWMRYEETLMSDYYMSLKVFLLIIAVPFIGAFIYRRKRQKELDKMVSDLREYASES